MGGRKPFDSDKIIQQINQLLNGVVCTRPYSTWIVYNKRFQSIAFNTFCYYLGLYHNANNYSDITIKPEGCLKLAYILEKRGESHKAERIRKMAEPDFDLEQYINESLQ